MHVTLTLTLTASFVAALFGVDHAQCQLAEIYGRIYVLFNTSTAALTAARGVTQFCADVGGSVPEFGTRFASHPTAGEAARYRAVRAFIVQHSSYDLYVPYGDGFRCELGDGCPPANDSEFAMYWENYSLPQGVGSGYVAWGKLSNKLRVYNGSYAGDSDLTPEFVCSFSRDCASDLLNCTGGMACLKDTNYTNAGQCACTGGYTGDDCMGDIDECSDMTGPCSANGTCTNTVPGYYCACDTLGYTGDDCSTDIDDCASNPCNNQTCIDLLNGYMCDCRNSGFMGDSCQVEIDECVTLVNPCRNGGQCTDRVNGVDCDCSGTGFTGSNCEVNIDNCVNATCVTNATCLDGTNTYICMCPPGYTGPNCDMEINECATSPNCSGLPCIDLINAYECNCTGSGRTGRACEINIDECVSAPCVGNATCRDGMNGYTCPCDTVGYTGESCETNIDDCAAAAAAAAASNVSAPCRGQTCIDGINGYMCDCAGSGYTGDECDVDIDDCASDPCLNNGVCTDRLNDVECNCTGTGFVGELCEMNIDDCPGHD